MESIYDTEIIPFSEEILDFLFLKKYENVICTPVNLEIENEALPSQSGRNEIQILITPIHHVAEGFKLLQQLHLSSFLLTIEELQEEILETKEPFLKYLISKKHIS